MYMYMHSEKTNYVKRVSSITKSSRTDPNAAQIMSIHRKQKAKSDKNSPIELDNAQSGNAAVVC